MRLISLGRASRSRGKNRCSRVASRAELGHCAPVMWDPFGETEIEALPGNDLRARSQNPLVQNPSDREIKRVWLASAQNRRCNIPTSSGNVSAHPDEVVESVDRLVRRPGDSTEQQHA